MSTFFILPCKGRGNSRRLVEGCSPLDVRRARHKRSHPSTTGFAGGPPPLAGEDF